MPSAVIAAELSCRSVQLQSSSTGFPILTTALTQLLQTVKSNYVLGTQLVWSGITSTSRFVRQHIMMSES